MMRVRHAGLLSLALGTVASRVIAGMNEVEQIFQLPILAPAPSFGGPAPGSTKYAADNRRNRGSGAGLQRALEREAREDAARREIYRNTPGMYGNPPLAA